MKAKGIIFLKGVVLVKSGQYGQYFPDAQENIYN